MANNDKNLNKANEIIEKSQFEFVQKEDKIYDKKFQTKPIGYFKDAMLRFAKNKTNVIATSILVLLILLSVFVPIFSTKNAERLESQLAELPPRIPILDKFGIADGTSKFKNRPASRTNPYINIDTGEEIDGLFLPEGEFSEFVIKGTLKNYYLECTDIEATCEGGTVQIAKASASRSAGVFATIPSLDDSGAVKYSRQTISGIWIPDSVIMELKIDQNNNLNQSIIDGTSSLKMYFQKQDNDKTLVLIFDSSNSATYDSYVDGLFTVDFFDHPKLAFGPEKYRVLFTYDSDSRDSAMLESIKLSASSGASKYGVQGPNRDYIIYSEGFNLAKYELATDIIVDGNSVYSGNILRAGGERLNASYVVDSYAKAFGPVYMEGFPGSEYETLVQGCTYEDGTPIDTNNPVPGMFNSKCPIRQLVKRNDEDKVTIGGEDFYTYDVELNYQIYAGYNKIPYFLFGTSAAGYDMVKLVWIGLRTSLLIGLFVSFINIAIGVVYGAVSGYYGGQVDIIMQRFAEIIGRIPWLVTLSIFMAFFDAGFTSLILILIVSGWIGVASITRTQFYRYKGREYVLASRTLGAKDGRLIFRHILPNGIGTIITSSILMIPAVIFSEATLSYLGFGIGHGQSFKLFGIDALELSGVSIGVLLNDGRNKLQNFPHLTIFPAIIISILMITFNMFGNALRDAFNPALRGSE